MHLSSNNIFNYKKIIIYIIISLAFASCSNKNDDLRLISKFLEEEKLDSAKTLYNKIDTSVIESEKDSAMYNLIKTWISYLTNKSLKNDSIINYSINYYTNTKDNKLLAESYYYRGVSRYGRGQHIQAIKDIKNAEYYSRNIKDTVLRHKIIENLAYSNIDLGEKKLGKYYSDINLIISLESGNNNWISYAYGAKAMSCMQIGRIDSMKYYVLQCVPYLNAVDKKERSSFYTSIGVALKSVDVALSKVYFLRAIEYGDEPNAYNNLGELYYNEGNVNNAEKMWEKALTTDDMTIKCYILKNMQYHYAQSGNYLKAYDASAKLNAEEKKIREYQNTIQVRELQLKYDIDKKNQEREKTILFLTSSIIICILIITILALVYINKTNNQKKKMLQLQLVIKDYELKMETLKSISNCNNKEIINLSEKLKDLKERQSSMLFDGKKLYDRIMNGENVLTWGKNDYIQFIEYYRMLDMPFIEHLEKDYDNLSPRNMFYLILYHIGKTDKEVENIMAVSAITIRTTRNRINAKQKH